jgi:electron transfer flavoprotein beta subunit
MKILVCIKQVPDMESTFRINAEGTGVEERDLAFRINEYDEYALEQAIRVKEEQGNAPDVTVLSIGPTRVVEAIKKGLAMGADRGVHILDEQASQRDPFQIASAIAAFARDKNFDLIFTGMQSQDMGSAQVGPILAELLGLACVTTIVSFTLEGEQVTVRRELEGGVKAVVKLKLPALVTCQLGLNTPRYPTLPNIMKARQKELLKISMNDLTHEDSFSVTQKMSKAEKKGSGLILEGTDNDLADKLVSLLKEKTGVLR